MRHIGTYTVGSLVVLIGIPSAVFTISNTVWLGKRWKGSNSHCVCECVCVQTAWSAVLSYRKSRGRPPLVICAREVENDSSFPPLYPPILIFSPSSLLFKSHLTPLMSTLLFCQSHFSCFSRTFLSLFCIPSFSSFLFVYIIFLLSKSALSLHPSPSTAFLPQLLIHLFTLAHVFTIFHSSPLRKILGRGVMASHLY